MAVFTVACPKCGKVLKTGNPIAAGKKVKCPGCQSIFAMPAEEARKKASPIQAKAPAAPGGKSPSPIKPGAPAKKTQLHTGPMDDEDEAPRKKKPILDDDDDLPRKGKTRLSRADEDDDDFDDEDDDRPSKKKKKKKDKQSSKLPIFLGVGGGLGLILVFVITAFVWPGFLLSSSPQARPGPNPGPGPAPQAQAKLPLSDDLLTYAPANTFVLLSVDFANLRRKPLSAQIGLGYVQGFTKNQAGLDEVLLDSDQMLMFSFGPGREAVALLATKPYDADKVRQDLKAGPAQTFQDVTYYRLPAGLDGKSSLLAMPTPRVLLLGDDPLEDFGGLLAANGRQVNLSPDLQAMVQRVKAGPLWGAAVNDGDLKNKLQTMNPKGYPPFVPAGMVPPLQKSKAGRLAVDFPGGTNIKVELALICAEDADAAAFKKGLEGAVRGFMAMLDQMLPKRPVTAPNPIGSLLTDVNKNLKVDVQGPEVSATIEISEKALQELGNLKVLPDPGPGKSKYFPSKGPSKSKFK